MTCSRDEEKRDPAQADRPEIPRGQRPRSQGWRRTIRRPRSFDYRNACEDDEGYRLTDLAVRTGLSTSTVHRLLTTLEKRRFVQFDRDESMWHIGAQSFAVGSTFLRRRNFLTQALPYLRKLRDQTRETTQTSARCR